MVSPYDEQKIANLFAHGGAGDDDKSGGNSSSAGRVTITWYDNGPTSTLESIAVVIAVVGVLIGAVVVFGYLMCYEVPRPLKALEWKRTIAKLAVLRGSAPDGEKS